MSTHRHSIFGHSTSETTTPDLRNLERQYRAALLDDVLPFWEKHSLDTRDGGFFSCLARDGSVYDTDKFVWPQCRQTWLFAMLYTRLEHREDWLRIAEHGFRFLRAHGRDPDRELVFRPSARRHAARAAV